MVYFILGLCRILFLLCLVSYVFRVIGGFIRWVAGKYKNEPTQSCLSIFYRPLLGLYKFFESPEDPKDKNVYRVLGVALIVGFIFTTLSLFIQTDTIGSIFEKDDYQAQYYVNLFPEGSETKNYRVKADIQASKRTDSDGEETYTTREYHLIRVYFPNGGSISFEYNDNALELGNKVYMIDDNEKGWEVELTAEKVK